MARARPASSHCAAPTGPVTKAGRPTGLFATGSAGQTARVAPWRFSVRLTCLAELDVAGRAQHDGVRRFLDAALAEIEVVTAPARCP